MADYNEIPEDSAESYNSEGFKELSAAIKAASESTDPKEWRITSERVQEYMETRRVIQGDVLRAHGLADMGALYALEPEEFKAIYKEIPGKLFLNTITRQAVACAMKIHSPEMAEIAAALRQARRFPSFTTKFLTYRKKGGEKVLYRSTSFMDYNAVLEHMSAQRDIDLLNAL